MRKSIEKLIYRKWFYGFLAVVLWLDTWTDISELAERYSNSEMVSTVLSAIGASLVTLVFVDLHWRWPPRLP